MAAVFNLKENSTGDLEVTVSGEEWSNAVDKAFKKLANKISIPGFRKGKVPAQMLEKYVSENQRMMQAVPSSTVILTNPTHISIAIRYEQGKDTTPIVVAKGVDEVAFRIREIAKSHDIPIIENVPLARLIYKEVDIDQEIPEEMYKAVAEVLVAVYKIKNKYK